MQELLDNPLLPQVLAAVVEHEPMGAIGLAMKSGVSLFSTASALDDLDLLGYIGHEMRLHAGENQKVWFITDRAKTARLLGTTIWIEPGPRQRLSALAGQR